MRIAVATVGTAGDVVPFAILARALVARGHQVTAVTWPVHRATLAQPGVRVEVAGPHADPGRIASVAAEAARHGPMAQVAILRDFHLADGEAHYRRLRTLLPGHDLALIHGIHTLAHAAVLDDGLRWASVMFDPVLLPTATTPPPGMPSLGPLNRVAWRLLDGLLARAGRPLDDLLARAGSEQRGLPMFRGRSSRLHVVACSPSLIVVPPDLPPGTQVTGAWLDRSEPRPLPAELAAFLDDGAPPVVIAFGSMAGASDAVLADAIRRLLESGARIVVQGPMAGELGSPSLLRIGSVDHRGLFPRAGLVVHHGGAGTTHAACAAGVPSLVVPHVGDQRYWGDRLHRLGMAPEALPVDGLRAERLTEAARIALADREMRSRAQELATRLSAEDGVGTTVTLLERIGH
ncbi:MAG TPA: glycosyltransferase [Candidatus Limnocylindria bacterium]|nr:glycosyltransferase [Candidatus Limnocylindria bacterium]